MRAGRLFADYRDDAQADPVADHVGIARGAEGRAADLAGEQHDEVVAVGAGGALLAVEPGLEGDGAGDAANGELAGDGGAYITGETIQINGGMYMG